MTDFGKRRRTFRGSLLSWRDSILVDRLETSWRYSRIPDRRACIMKYRSGNARRAPTRGAFAFEFPDRISPSFSLRHCWRAPLFPVRSGYLTSSELPGRVRNVDGLVLPANVTSSPSSIASLEKEKFTERASQPTPTRLWNNRPKGRGDP